MRAVAFVVLLWAIQQYVSSQTYLTVYEHNHFRGKSKYLGNIDSYSYYPMTGWWNDQITSFQINPGSCVKVFKDNPPNYRSGRWFWTTNVDWRGFSDKYWNDEISSFEKCGTYSRSVSCPVGTFVKKIEWDKSNSLKNGIMLHCYVPKSLTPSRPLRTHGGGALSGNAECTGVRGISLYRNGRLNIDSGMTPICRTSSSGNSQLCPDKSAISGINLSIENYSGFVKWTQITCKNVGNIEEICAAHDKNSTLFICDATAAQFPLKCSHAKTVGYGISKSQSQEMRREYTFYKEFGFDIGASAYGLSANFRTNLGESKTTGYSWSATQESSFREETTVTVEAEAPVGCITTVTEVVGECSFLQVRPLYFRRHDNCSGALFTTDVPIPKNFKTTRVFASRMPQKVLSHLQLTKGNFLNNANALKIGENGNANLTLF